MHQKVLHLYETIYQGYKQDIFVNLTLYGAPKVTPLVWDSIFYHKQVIFVSLTLYGTPKGSPLLQDSISSL